MPSFQPIYASIDLLLVAEIPQLSAISSSFQDINLIDIPEYPNGTYRLLTPEFIRWIAARVKLAADPKSGVPVEALQLRQAFLDECKRRSGLSESQNALRSDYRRPDEATAFTFRGTLDLWEATRPENPLAGIDGVGGIESSEPIRSLPDFIPKPPCSFLLCRGPSVANRYFRSTMVPCIAAGYTEYLGMGSCNWHPVRPEWIFQDGQPGDDNGIWTASPSPAESEPGEIDLLADPTPTESTLSGSLSGDSSEVELLF